ncbi:ankyrin repeat domain-containing protein 27-like [Adelges cooleyi]|uniref:ankyrin repeat domain-containing protein 27-like n=1 Tax=Adelges cooleyi TaxID=133065 RepID=UPI00217F82A6|nr:ankyrin repeat domain-containing protein 27-like [Adelges cooleyi]
MDHSYDEDVTLNQFLVCLCKSSVNTFYQAVDNGWLICVPRDGSFSKNTFTVKDFNDHILTPSKCTDFNFMTLSGHNVSVNNKSIQCHHDNQVTAVDILFVETCYTEDSQSYKIICTNGPLTSATITQEIIIIQSTQDCLNFLYSKNNKSLLKDLRYLVDTFLLTYSFSNMHIDEQRKTVNILYNKCLRKAYSNFKSPNSFFQDNIKLAVEYYVYNRVYNILIRNINICVAKDDSILNKLIQNYSSFPLDLDVDKDIEAVIPNARCELSKLYIHRTIIGKYKCLKDTFLKLSNGNNNFTVDNLLNALVNLIIHCKIPNWSAQIYFMKNYIMSNNKDFDDNFYLTSLEAAIEHIKTYSFNIDLFITANDSKYSLFFNHVRSGDYQKVKKTLDHIKIETSSSMCHPLCECDSCIKQVYKESMICVNYKDDQGLTPLHIAAFYGHPLIVELLLQYGSDINALDNFLRTPAHYAALRGQQNALLFLLHKKASMSGDNEGNTPLHLCCSNGQESCVKALLYFMEFSDSTLDINIQNNQGNTPLHLCFKWGYSNLVDILLEQTADPLVCNRRGQTCFDCAHNFKMVEQFSAYKKKSIERVRKRSIEVTQQQRVIDKILTAISDGDIRLAQYYLGIDNENQCTKRCVYVNCANNKGYTPLHVAAMHGQNDIVNMLIKHGSDINAVTTSEQFTALHLAVQHSMNETVIILLSSEKCDVNKQDHCGNSVLHYACASGNASLVTLIHKYGADWTVINKSFTSALDVLNKNPELRHLIFGYNMKKLH